MQDKFIFTLLSTKTAKKVIFSLCRQCDTLPPTLPITKKIKNHKPKFSGFDKNLFSAKTNLNKKFIYINIIII